MPDHPNRRVGGEARSRCETRTQTTNPRFNMPSNPKPPAAITADTTHRPNTGAAAPVLRRAGRGPSGVLGVFT